MRSLSIAGCLIIGTLATACAAPPVQAGGGPRLPEPGPSQQYRVAFPDLGRGSARSRLRQDPAGGPPVAFPDLGRGSARYIVLTLGDDVAASCGNVNAHFAFDSAEPLPQDQLRVRDVVDCLNLPSNKDHDVLLVGRADARGTSAYNQALGQRRAERVKQILVDAGVEEERIRAISGGDWGAMGDERQYSHGYDRRVDVGLLGTVHAPRRP